MTSIPKWVDVVIVPIVSLLLAAAISALVMLAIGENPWTALKLMITGALGSSYGWGYTLYYTTNFIFTGLAVAIAFHTRIFNIGGEGQAALGGLGVALACLYIPWPHWSLALVGAAVAAGLFGASDAAALIHFYATLWRVQMATRLLSTGEITAQDVGAGGQAILMRAVGTQTIQDAQEQLTVLCARAAKIIAWAIGQPTRGNNS